MLRFFFLRLINQLIDSVDDLTFSAYRADAEETLRTFRDVVVKQLADYDKMMPDDSTFLRHPKDRRVHNAKRGVYLAIIELIDAKADSLTD